jgi:hypothetical protein
MKPRDLALERVGDADHRAFGDVLGPLSTSSSGQNGQEASILHGDDAVGDVKNAIIYVTAEYSFQPHKPVATSVNKRRRAFENLFVGSNERRKRMVAEENGMPERPSELVYALDEKPPWPHLLALGFQHVTVIAPIW